MGTRKEYWCDLCDDRHTREEAIPALVGVRFVNNDELILGEPQATDGHHVCRVCLRQLYEQAPKILMIGV